MDGSSFLIVHALHLFTFAELSGKLKVRYDTPENIQIIGIPGSREEERGEESPGGVLTNDVRSFVRQNSVEI